jgi:hypothetical protein
MSPRNRSRRALGDFTASPLRTLVWISAASGVLIAAGCSLNKDQLSSNKVITRVGGRTGEIIEPKRCLLEVAIVTRPLGDKTINESVWSAADMQCIPEEARRLLDANGVRIGKIIGALPPDLESALHAPPPHKVEPIAYLPEINEPVEIRTIEKRPQLNLLLNLDNRAIARDYELAAGVYRVLADHDGERGISLRMVPEIHHGPVKQGYQPIANAGAYPSNQLTIATSQQKDSLLELASTLVLQPGEAALLSCDVNRDRSLGSFLFTFDEANSDRKMQHLVLIWASRNRSGTIEANKLHSSVDRPAEHRGAKPQSAGGKGSGSEAEDAFRNAEGVKGEAAAKPST